MTSSVEWPFLMVDPATAAAAAVAIAVAPPLDRAAAADEAAFAFLSATALADRTMSAFVTRCIFVLCLAPWKRMGRMIVWKGSGDRQLGIVGSVNFNSFGQN